MESTALGIEVEHRMKAVPFQQGEYNSAVRFTKAYISGTQIFERLEHKCIELSDLNLNHLFDKDFLESPALSKVNCSSI